MRLVATESLEPGMTLAKTIYNDKGQILLSEGVILGERVIHRLMEKGISFLYIEDPNTKDIAFHEPIPIELKQKALSTIESTFEKVQKDDIYTSSVILEKNSKKFVEIVRSLLKEIKNNNDLLSVLSDLFVYDDYVFAHSFNVALYSLAVGMELKLSERELEVLGLGSLLHDIGKLKVPERILFKPGKLTGREFEIIKKHSQDGFDILRNVHTVSLLVAHCAFQHHERVNGSGYPRGIKGDEIHPFAKIIAVADVFDAVTSNRVYRKAMLPSTGLEVLYGGVGQFFEAEIVNAFRKSVAIYPVGLTVELSDGRKGVVSRQNKEVSDRPIIRILEEKGHKVQPYEIDLLEELSVVITNCDTAFLKEWLH